MKVLTNRFTKRVCGVLVVAMMLAAGSVSAGPPLATDDTGLVDPGHLEIEINGSYARDGERSAGVRTRTKATDAEIKLSTGIVERMGISLAMPYVFSERTYENGRLVDSVDGLGDMLFEFKYVFYDNDALSFMLKPTLLIPTGKYRDGLSEGRWQPGVTLVATKEFDDGKYALHANAGYEYHSWRTTAAKAENRNHLWMFSIAGEAEVAEKLTAVADFGVARAGDSSTNTPAVYGLFGLRYEINNYLDINCGVKVGLTRPEDDVAALYGIVLKF